MIIAIPTKTLTPSQKALLNKKGYIVIETDNPEKIRIISAEMPVDTHDYYMAALHALQKDNSTMGNSYFIRELYRRLNEKQTIEVNEEKTIIP